MFRKKPNSQTDELQFYGWKISNVEHLVNSLSGSISRLEIQITGSRIGADSDACGLKNRSYYAISEMNDYKKYPWNYEHPPIDAKYIRHTEYDYEIAGKTKYPHAIVHGIYQLDNSGTDMRESGVMGRIVPDSFQDDEGRWQPILNLHFYFHEQKDLEISQMLIHNTILAKGQAWLHVYTNPITDKVMFLEKFRKDGSFSEKFEITKVRIGTEAGNMMFF